MPPRPSFRSKDSVRPLSAIYIGNQSHASNNNNNNGHTNSGSITASVGAPSPVPDLPEPPSPVSSVGSGLPSPPATNSTGSGSTGDPGSIAVRRSAPSPMPSGQTIAANANTHTISSDSSNTVSTSSRSSSRLSWKPGEHYDLDDLDQDEDQTMRLRVGASSEATLQRAHKLLQRNKIELDKMSSSGLATVSPSFSPASRSNRHSLPDPSQVLSGSETEREGDSTVFHSTSSSGSRSKISDSSSYHRVRLSSAPTSPHKARTEAAGTYSPIRRRKRMSLASASSASFDDNSDDGENEFYNDRSGRDGERYEMGTAKDRIRDGQDTLRNDRVSTRAPTVNLNSIKKTPLGGARRRSALPREFREGSADEVSISFLQHNTFFVTTPLQYPNSTNSDLPPQTPYRPASATSTPVSAATETISTTTSAMNTLGRRSTVRSGRGLSDDFRNSPTYSSRDLPFSSSIRSGTRNTPNTPLPPASAPSSKTTHTFNNSLTITRSNTIGRQTQTGVMPRERRQTLRGGSAESALGSNGRSLVGEGLRAAGLSKRISTGRERERTLSGSGAGVIETREARGSSGLASSSDISGNNDRASVVSAEGRHRINDTGGRGDTDVFRERQRKVDWSPDTTGSLTRPRRTVGELGAHGAPPRASTSMADYSYSSRLRHQPQSDDEDLDDPDSGGRDGRALRAYKSAHPLLSSREASLTRREQSLLEKERELGRRERELERTGSVMGRHQDGNMVPITPAPTPTPYSAIRDRERYTSPFGSVRRTAFPASTNQQYPVGQQHQLQSEHTRLMVESLSLFESQLSKLAPSLGPGTNHAEMLSRNAQALVLSAERLNGMLRTGNNRALDAQIEAEVDGDLSGPGGGKSLVEVWRKIGGDYREGLRASDELVRALTGLLLGVGRVMKEYVHLGMAGPSACDAVESAGLGGMPRGLGGSPVVHGRSISLSNEDLRGRGGPSPDLRTSSTKSGGGSGDGGSRGSRRSWEPAQNGTRAGEGGSSSASLSTAGSREEALRRLAGVRSDSPLARASPAFQAARELDRLETASPALGPTGSGLPKVNIPAARRLFAPSQQREMALVAFATDIQGADYDPSPTPISRTRVFDRAELGVPPSQQLRAHSPLQPPQPFGDETLERSRTLSRLVVPQSGAVLETPLRRNITISGDDSNRASLRDRHDRRKVSVTSISTIRASAATTSTGTSGSTSAPSVSSGVGVGPPGFSALTAPRGATAVVTVDGTIGMIRTESGPEHAGSVHSMTAQPTFSKPEGMTSVTGLQQQLEVYKKKTESEIIVESSGSNARFGPGFEVGDDNAGEKGRNGMGASLLITPESERETRRRTLGSRFGQRMSLDSVLSSTGIEAGETERAGKVVAGSNVNAADRSAAATVGGTRRERRRTVTDIWPRS